MRASTWNPSCPCLFWLNHGHKQAHRTSSLAQWFDVSDPEVFAASASPDRASLDTDATPGVVPAPALATDL